jgi:hypothetical protein
VPLEEKLVSAKGFSAGDVVLVALDDFVEEQHRRAMRDGGEDFGEGHDKGWRLRRDNAECDIPSP